MERMTPNCYRAANKGRQVTCTEWKAAQAKLHKEFRDLRRTQREREVVVCDCALLQTEVRASDQLVSAPEASAAAVTATNPWKDFLDGGRFVRPEPPSQPRKVGRPSKNFKHTVSIQRAKGLIRKKDPRGLLKISGDKLLRTSTRHLFLFQRNVAPSTAKG